ALRLSGAEDARAHDFGPDRGTPHTTPQGIWRRVGQRMKRHNCPEAGSGAMTRSFDINHLRWRLAETIAWCAPLVSLTDVRDSLRTRALLPGYLACGQRAPIGGLQVDLELYEYEPHRMQALVEALAEERARRLRVDR